MDSSLSLDLAEQLVAERRADAAAAARHRLDPVNPPRHLTFRSRVGAALRSLALRLDPSLAHS